jgi:hypothetical protein
VLIAASDASQNAGSGARRVQPLANLLVEAMGR